MFRVAYVIKSTETHPKSEIEDQYVIPDQKLVHATVDGLLTPVSLSSEASNNSDEPVIVDQSDKRGLGFKQLCRN